MQVLARSLACLGQQIVQYSLEAQYTRMCEIITYRSKDITIVRGIQGQHTKFGMRDEPRREGIDLPAPRPVFKSIPVGTFVVILEISGWRWLDNAGAFDDGSDTGRDTDRGQLHRNLE